MLIDVGAGPGSASSGAGAGSASGRSFTMRAAAAAAVRRCISARAAASEIPPDVLSFQPTALSDHPSYL
eukprot:5366764-Prymnesium_polylepis.1